MTDSYLAHYGVKGMRWGKRNPRNANYDDNQVKRDKQVYGARGAKNINKSLNKGNSISVARGDEKTRRDRVMGKNKYVRQAGKVVGAGVAVVGANVGVSAIRSSAATRLGRSTVDRVFGKGATDLVQTIMSDPLVRPVVTLGAAQVANMFAGDLAVSANMRLNGYDPSRK